MARVVVGLDLSYTSTGVSTLFDGVFQPLSSFTFGTTPKQGTDIERAALIGDKIVRHLRSVERANGEVPNIAIEGYAFGRTYNQAKMGELGGVVKGQLLANGYTWETIPVTAIRKVITGKGNGKKDQVMYFLLKRHNLDITQNDLADATALALTFDYVVRARERKEEMDTWLVDVRDAVKTYMANSGALA